MGEDANTIMGEDANNGGKNRAALWKFLQRKRQVVAPEILCGKNLGRGGRKQVI